VSASCNIIRPTPPVTIQTSSSQTNTFDINGNVSLGDAGMTNKVFYFAVEPPCNADLFIGELYDGESVTTGNAGAVQFFFINIDSSDNSGFMEIC
jgi:hypothetical protein